MTMFSPMRLLTVWLFILFVTQLSHGATPINLRVVWTENPQTQATVLWDSIGGGEGSLVVGNGEENTPLKATVSQYSMKLSRSARKADTSSFLTHCYSVVLKDLKPSTKYLLTAKIGGESTKEHYFITAPDKDVDFKLFFAGDSRSNVSNARKVSLMMKDVFEKDSSYIALLHGGDFAKSPNINFWTPWLEAYSLTTAPDGRLLPIIPVRGNHEGSKGGMFDVAYGNPGEAKNYFTCMPSPEVAIVVLNSMQPAEGEQKAFLEAELTKLQSSKVRFQMTAYHTPLYPAIKAPHRAKQSWAPLFEKYNIDLGLESDGHCIKRTVPIRGDKKVDDGVVYLGEGGYGAPQRSYKGDRWYLEKPGFVGKGEHYMVLSFTPKAIEYSAEQLGKGKVDSASFPARSR